MSAPPSLQVAPGKPYKKRERPPALDLPDASPKAASDTDVQYQRETYPVQPSVLLTPATEDPPMDLDDNPASRPASATSSLDPYYFGIQSPTESPMPPLPTSSLYPSTTPEQRSINEPVTPARDPAAIDRRGLVGVGELATPRWTRAAQDDSEDTPEPDAAADGFEVIVPEDLGDDAPDSPWTIEAIDGEGSEREELLDIKAPPRAIRQRPSIAEESGGEEILYPRKHEAPVPELPKRKSSDEPKSPPSAFAPPARRAKKRTSDEFELDQTGSLVSKRVGSSSIKQDKSKDDTPKATARKHRSLTGGSISNTSSGKPKERRRESVGLTISSSLKSTPKPERHSRQASASSSSSTTHADAVRRVHNTDFSHLPPSPSSSSIQQFLRTTSSTTSPHTPPLVSSKEHPPHASSNVAHSLLRGTQEGWSGLDDEATAEALRKLDGLSGKTARARASMSSLHRPVSSSRPGTPSSKSGDQWEGIGASAAGTKPSRRGSGNVRDSQGAGKEKESAVGLGIVSSESIAAETLEPLGAAFSSDEQPVHSSGPEKTPKKAGTASARSSFVAKRGSASSTTYTSTPTTSSRDSASMSAATSVTSVSAASGRHSTGNGKARRNSAGSDISSVHSGDAASLKDRVASLALNGDAAEEDVVPPVPPLPKDLSTYRSPPATAVSMSFPSMVQAEEKETEKEAEKRVSHETNVLDRTLSLEVPPSASSVVSDSGSSYVPQSHRQSQHLTSGYTTAANSAPESTSTPAMPRTPSKKWSFSNALNLNKLSSHSPSSSSASKSSFPLSPRSVTFGQQLRKSTSKDQALSPSTARWSPPTQPDAMNSASSLASLSSIGSIRTPGLPQATTSKTPDRGAVPSRAGTDSSASTNHTAFGLSAQSGPLSPSSSVRRGQSKRLTPSSIPFFRRSSSQSMQLPPSTAATRSSSPTLHTTMSATQSRYKTSSPDYAPLSTSVPGSTHKKSSVLSLGLPSLLKSSSRRSLNADSKEAAQRLKEAEKEKARAEKEKKKDDKDRSESRISVLMGRKRGKTLSSTDPRKPKSPVNLPPMQISALEPATAQRVARLKTSNSLSTSSSTSASSTTRAPSSSRLTSQTVSSMQKQSDSSLRSRNQLPTIAGSPSVGINIVQPREFKEPASSSLGSSTSGITKETPTKIPRISSRTSAVSSPPLKGSTFNSRRASVNVSGLATSTNSSPTGQMANEFGVMENGESQTVNNKAGVRNTSVRASPSTISTSRVPRQVSGGTSGSILPRKSNRDSISFSGLRKSSTGSVASVSTSAVPSDAPTSTSHHRFSALSPSKGLKLLSPKISLSTTRSSNSSGTQNIHQAMGSPSSSRQSLSTPSPAPSSVDEEEYLGDEEMLLYIKRQQTKKLAAGAKQEDLDDLLQFPEPLPPGTPSTPQAILKSSQAQYLSEYERDEMLKYPNVYVIGARSKKKPATLDNTTNNYGYDDERGDYLVVNHDHLAYRYEIIDTLGKGSFGQVLHCRDHESGESVAVKIIRNKKRFHHQALVEIKILDNLRKWDSDEKHHVIKMTEHFYFRNHLCIAMELLSINLYELIKANGFVGFTTALIRRFTSQMLLSLSLMRHHRIVHCDLKPENVLLRHPAKSAIKVIDFGSSCFEHEKIYTYIQSRFYRSPEVILGMNYHMAIDMWSLGCILAELYTGFPIFPGENEQEQLSCIMEVLGAPEKEFVNRSSRKKLFFDPNGQPRPVVNSKGRRRKPGTKTLAQVLRCNDEEFVDFIGKCLVWDPERRIKPQAAMRHPFVTAGRRPKPPPSVTKSTLSTSSLTGGRRKEVTETPKKSLIGAPTPLTARTSRTTTSGNPTTPSTSSQPNTIGSARSYRVSQPQGLTSYHSSRTLNGFATSAK